MPAAVPAIPPNPKIAAMIAITRNVNAQLSMIQNRAAVGLLNRVSSHFGLSCRPPWGSHLLSRYQKQRL
jgi:hypothetical protein